MGFLIGLQLRLGGERNECQVFERADVARSKPRLGELAGIEAVTR